MRRNIRSFFLWLLSSSLLLAGCSSSAQPIDYGKDQCHFCKMTIVDQQHAAQAVTKKGKQFKYDSIECMVNEFTRTGQEAKMGILLVSSFGQSKMVPALDAVYLISPGIESPMGANLSAFERKDAALAAQKEHQGEIYSWQALPGELSKQKP